MLPLVRFHWAAGARVALRANAVVLGVVVFVFGSAPDGLATLKNFVLDLVARGHGGASRGVFAAIAFAFAGTAAPRVLLGASGWMRSLPVEARASWRAAAIALCMAQLAVATFVPICVLAAAFVYHADVSPAKVASLAVMIAAVAAAALPSRRLHTRLIAAFAVGLSVVGTWPTIVASIVCLAIAVHWDRRLSVRATRSASRPDEESLGAGDLDSSGLARDAAAGNRRQRCATGRRRVIRVLHHGEQSGASSVHRRNGRSCLRSDFVGAVRWCAPRTRYFATRQPWPWARSLPWSARHRVLGDACLLGIPLCAVPLGLSAVSATQALWSPASSLAATSASAAVRGAGNRQTGAAGECMVVLLVAGGAIAMWPPLSLGAIAATPFFVWLGARRERNRVATRWVELHHAATGDPGWLSGA